MTLDEDKAVPVMMVMMLIRMGIKKEETDPMGYIFLYPLELGALCVLSTPPSLGIVYSPLRILL